ncbi:MAG: sensor histidine kinase [Polaromonas sp.]
MFRFRLALALGLLMLMVLAQAGLAVSLTWQVEHHERRNRIAQGMLNEYVELSANKQRLKVWYAQLLLTQDAPMPTRDLLLKRMQESMDSLAAFAVEERASADGALENAVIAQTDRTLQLLKINVANLSSRILSETARQLLREPPDSGVIWADMIAVFDIAEGRDVRLLLAGAIERHVGLSQQAASAADRALARMEVMMVLSVLFTALLTVALVVYFTRWLRRPVDDLIFGTQALQSDRLDHRIPENRRDEFGQLARSFNAMASEIQRHRGRETAARADLEDRVTQRTLDLQAANEQLQRIDARRRQFFADISHELRTPATAILGEAEVALRARQPQVEELRDALGQIAETTRQLSARVTELLTFARGEEESLTLPLVPADLRQGVIRAVDGLRARAEIHQLQLGLEVPDTGCSVNADPPRLQQLVEVLIDNALRYTPAGGQVEVLLQPSPCGGVPGFQLTVRDTGIGLMEQEHALLFDRHFRGQHARLIRPDGVGLGLSIAQAIAQAHGAQLSLHQRAEGGTDAVLWIPQAAAQIGGAA